MEENLVPDPSCCNLPELSAEEVHKNILRLHYIRHRVDRKLLGWLFILIDRGFFKAIHKSTPVLYVMDFLKYQESEAGEVVRVAKALSLLPRLAETFEKGEICWSQVKLISSVAKEETEEDWLAFRKTHSAGALRAEVKNALEKGRDRPRKGTRGIPNTTVDMKFRFTLEEMELARQGLELAASEMMAAGDGTRPTPEKVLLFLAKRVLESDLELKPGAGSKKIRSIWQLIYQKCPDCLKCLALTRDGPVEVPHEHVQKIEAEAEKLVIEPHELIKGEVLPPGSRNEAPVPADVERKVLARYRHSCVICGRRGDLHLHHVIFRSCGGRNEILNIAPCCPPCHASVHDGVVEVFLDSTGEVHVRSKADRIQELLKEEIEEFAAVAPAVVVVRAGPRELSGTNDARSTPQMSLAPSEPAASPVPALDPALERECEFIAAALGKIGHAKNDARALVREALKRLEGLGRLPSGNEILNAAVRLGACGIKSYRSRICGNQREGKGKEPPPLQSFNS
jgi:HNH endonuclease